MIAIELDLEKMKVRHLRDLERSKTVDELLAWLRTHTNMTNGTEDAVLDMSLPEMTEFILEIRQKITAGMQLPKANGSNS